MVVHISRIWCGGKIKEERRNRASHESLTDSGRDALFQQLHVHSSCSTSQLKVQCIKRPRSPLPTSSAIGMSWTSTRRQAAAFIKPALRRAASSSILEQSSARVGQLADGNLPRASKMCSGAQTWYHGGEISSIIGLTVKYHSHFQLLNSWDSNITCII